jgi:hypothetical protein
MVLNSLGSFVPKLSYLLAFTAFLRTLLKHFFVSGSRQAKKPKKTHKKEKVKKFML